MKVIFLKKGDYADNRGVFITVTDKDVKSGKAFDMKHADNIESYVKGGLAVIECMVQPEETKGTKAKEA